MNGEWASGKCRSDASDAWPDRRLQAFFATESTRVQECHPWRDLHQAKKARIPGRAHDTLRPLATLAASCRPSIATAQKRYLRSLAHDLKPVILVGAKGVTPALLAELDLALEHHELVKLKIAAGDRDERDAWVNEILKASGVALVQRVGNIATVFRARRKNPGIVLPR